MPLRQDGVLSRSETAGPALYFHATWPDKPRVAVALLHGYAEHGARYAHVADAWSERGIATLAIDLRGHGRSEGRRGHCAAFQDFLDDGTELEHLVRDRLPGLPAVLFGHSFGGLVATSMALTRPSPWRALALSSPFFDVAQPVPAAPKRIAGAIASRIAPAFALPTGLSGKDVTHDPERARAYDEDPLGFPTATARWFTETRAAQARALAHASSLKLPLLVVAALADRLVSPARARAFFDGAGSADKTWDGREGLFHEVLNEVDWRPIADRFGEWMVEHAAERP
jgi:alpha-beta hydrolase superfamily lysophospholipase